MNNIYLKAFVGGALFYLYYSLLKEMQNESYRHGYTCGLNEGHKRRPIKIVEEGNILRYPFNPKQTADLIKDKHNAVLNPTTPAA